MLCTPKEGGERHALITPMQSFNYNFYGSTFSTFSMHNLLHLLWRNTVKQRHATFTFATEHKHMLFENQRMLSFL